MNGELEAVVYGGNPAFPLELDVIWGDLVVLEPEVIGTGTCLTLQVLAEDLSFYRGTSDFCGSDSTNEHLSWGSFESSISNGEYGFCTLGSGERRIKINRLTTGIHDDLSNEFNLFPNPITSELVVSKENWSQPFNYQLVDLKGNLIRTGKLNTNTRIDFSSIPSGVYCLNLQGEEGILRKKIVVQ